MFFEPCHTHFRDLRQLQQDSKRDIAVVKKAVWNKNGFAKYYQYHNDLANTIAPNPLLKDRRTGLQVVETIDVADILNEHKNDYVIVKMDIEGAEVEVIRRMLDTNTLRHVNELLVEYHRYRSNEIRVLRKIIKSKKAFEGIYLIWDY